MAEDKTRCEQCGWVGADSLLIEVRHHDDADIMCPACQQVIEGLEVDWKERCSHAENELADVRHDLAAAVDRVIATNERAKVAEAEVAAWRRAVRWYEEGAGRLELRMCTVGAYCQTLAAVSQYTGGWTVEVHGAYKPGIQPDRNTACAKVCELLGLPVVLPGGE